MVMNEFELRPYLRTRQRRCDEITMEFNDAAKYHLQLGSLVCGFMAFGLKFCGLPLMPLYIKYYFLLKWSHKYTF